MALARRFKIRSCTRTRTSPNDTPLLSSIEVLLLILVVFLFPTIASWVFRKCVHTVSGSSFCDCSKLCSHFRV